MRSLGRGGGWTRLSPRSPSVDILPAHLTPSLLENLPDALLVVDMSGTIVVSNRCAREAGAPPAATLLEDWVADASREPKGGMWALDPSELSLPEALVGHDVVDSELAIERDGVRARLSVNVRCLRDAGGAIAGAMLVMHDVTASADLADRVRLQSAVA